MTTIHESRTADSLAERVFESALGTLDLFAIYVGDRLGYYRALAVDGPLTAAQLAAIAETDERYTVEWLEQQAVTGLVDIEQGNEDRYRLPDGYANALTDETSLSFIAPLARQILACGFQLPEIAAAHRNGGGVSWEEFGDEMRQSQGDLNRPVLEGVLAQEWFSAVPEIAQRLVPGARVADIGTGHGWASIGLAKTFPGIQIDAFDIDGPSVEDARSHADAAGVGESITYHEVDAGDPWIEGDYDLVFAIEMVHDLPDPVATLSTMRRIAKPGGLVVVGDMRVADSFDPASADEVERLMYGFSNFVCLPDAKSHSHSAATGTVMRPSTLRSYAHQAGFSEIVELPIEADFWRFFKLV